MSALPKSENLSKVRLRHQYTIAHTSLMNTPAVIRIYHFVQSRALHGQSLDPIPVSEVLCRQALSPRSVVAHRPHPRRRNSVHSDFMLLLLAHRLLLRQDYQGWSLRQSRGILVQLLGLQYLYGHTCLCAPYASPVASAATKKAKDQLDWCLCIRRFVCRKKAELCL